MLEPCPHCGAVPEGMLLGFPLVIHKSNCPNAPSLLKSIDVTKLVASLPHPKKFTCLGCGIEWDEVGEAEHKHALNCPWNPLRN